MKCFAFVHKNGSGNKLPLMKKEHCIRNTMLSGNEDGASAKVFRNLEQSIENEVVPTQSY